MTYKTPRARARGLGASGTGTHHWWSQRVSSVALIPLTILFVVPFAQALGGTHEEVLALYGHWFHALVAILFVAVSFWHLAQGIQVVIEDYVPQKGWRTGLVLANLMFCTVFGIAGVLAVLKIWLGV